jgi:hypothetical protein
MSIDVRRNERGAWCVYVRGNFISDHATHEAARIAAKQVERAESLAWRSGIGMAPDGVVSDGASDAAVDRSLAGLMTA